MAKVLAGNDDSKMPPPSGLMRQYVPASVGTYSTSNYELYKNHNYLFNSRVAVPLALLSYAPEYIVYWYENTGLFKMIHPISNKHNYVPINRVLISHPPNERGNL
jgi:hypothetical protein